MVIKYVVKPRRCTTAVLGESVGGELKGSEVVGQGVRVLGESVKYADSLECAQDNADTLKN